jgi:hypothetical protein
MRKIGLFLLLAASLLRAAVPTPTEHLGYAPGADYKLADYSDITGYFQKLAASSDRIRLKEFGKTSMGKPMYVAFISSAENLAKLERYQQMNRALALGTATAEEAATYAAESKAFVWIDSGLHATEVAPAQHSPELAWQMVTGESAEIRLIRQNVILIQIPVINPDGLDMVAHWYRKNVGTPYETASLPMLYQKYAGHDNNRDFFMLNLAETRAVTKLLFQEWFPHIVYNQHQQPAFPARIFVPPYAEPLNPNIPAPVMEGINLIGSTIKERFALENKAGAISYMGFDGWWNGGLRSVPAFHNMHGILTETAASGYATPQTYDAKDFPARFSNGIPTKEPTIFYQRPWMGGTWRIRDAIDYMLTADYAILRLASERRSDFLMKSYTLARDSIEKGKSGPYAYVIPREQWDRPTSVDMLERIAYAGVQVARAQAPFEAGGRKYSEGSYVVPASQPFRSYLVDLMETQKYPALKLGQNGPTKRPYDVAGWTLPMLMGVEVVRVEQPFAADLAPVGEFKVEGSVSGKGSVVTLDGRENAAYHAVNFFLGRNEPVRWTEDGKIVIESPYIENDGRVTNFARQFGITVHLVEKSSAKAAYELRTPKVAIYEPWDPNSDTGWTEYVLDRYQIAYSALRNTDFQNGDLRRRFDTIILASQNARSILQGFREGSVGSKDNVTMQRPEYAGGIGVQGAANLEQFVKAGGTLIALERAAELAIDNFALPVRRINGGSDDEDPNGFYSPGSLLRMTVDPTNPIAFGMPKEITAFASSGTAFDVTLPAALNHGDRETRSVVKFANKNLLASGWLSGERVALGKDAVIEARHGKGRVLLFAFRPQFRAQTHGTFKLLLNSVYLGSAQKL